MISIICFKVLIKLSLNCLESVFSHLDVPINSIMFTKLSTTSTKQEAANRVDSEHGGEAQKHDTNRFSWTVEKEKKLVELQSE